jgi:predicted nucleic acid-binding Zn ribbon protein
MSIYGYICVRCTAENREETLFYLTAKEPPKDNPCCPNCGSPKTARKWEPAVVHFRGNGFYSTDRGGKRGDDLNV